MQRQRKTKAPCLVCFLNPQLCICHLIPKLNLKTKVSLIIHHRELKRTTNTGRLALQALSNSEMRVRGLGRESLDLSDLLRPEYRSVLFYPSHDAVELDRSFVEQSSLPIQLIVPDGNWRQASKVHYRHEELRALPRVMIGGPNLSLFHLRAESSENGMATLQAIAMALAVTDGEEVGRELMDLYNAKLKQTLVGRGRVGIAKSLSGI
jgi:DTW domain-containing protein YfiP